MTIVLGYKLIEVVDYMIRYVVSVSARVKHSLDDDKQASTIR